ncbi:MAG: hydrolase [Paenibacillaceae bacterium]|jgi:8-oxo-dGTP diphosphatase|nr:hydrolase [Paenibacillaceae bacterium]
MICKRRAQAVIIRDGCLLMVRHFDLTIQQEYWCLPGGGVDPGELPEQTVVRELQEETGLVVAVKKLLHVDRFPEVTHGYNVAYSYLADIVKGELQLGYDPEYEGQPQQFLQEVKWIPIAGELERQLSSFFGKVKGW